MVDDHKLYENFIIKLYKYYIKNNLKDMCVYVFQSKQSKKS